MKKVFIFFVIFICFVSPVKVHSASAGVAALVAMIYAQDGVKYAIDKIFQVKQLAEDVASTVHLYEQVQHWIRNEERYLKNLKSIMDVRSFSDFMGWFNRSMYITRESERIYNDMGVKIGGKYYGLSEIDEIPDAARNEYADRHWGDLSESERYKAWTSLGMSPSNYLYMKTWQGRNEEIKKRLLTSREMHAEEMEDAASRNNDLLSQYSTSNEDIDSNTIAKNSGASLAQIEMQLRELGLTLDDFMAYVVTRDQEDKVLPNSMMPSESWNRSLYKPITNGKSKDNFEN